MGCHQPHPVTPGGAATPISDAYQAKRGKKRGNYNCGRCGLPKKGHSCHLPIHTGASSLTPIATPSSDSTSSVAIPSPLSAVRPPLLPSSRQPCSNLRRALSFDDIEVGDLPDDEEQLEMEMEVESDLFGLGKLPMTCLWEILKRLPPPALLSVAGVCKGWRDTAKRLWRAAEELRLRVPAKTQIGFVGSVLHKCPGLVRLSLRMERLGLEWPMIRSSDESYRLLNHKCRRETCCFINDFQNDLRTTFNISQEDNKMKHLRKISVGFYMMSTFAS